MAKVLPAVRALNDYAQIGFCYGVLSRNEKVWLLHQKENKKTLFFGPLPQLVRVSRS